MIESTWDYGATMVTETESDADLEFSAGHFDIASDIYSQQLLEIDDSQRSQRIVLLKKLGASQQQAGQFKESLQTFETLLENQDESNCLDEDKIVTYLKLAIAHEHCQSRHEADVDFKIAYKMARSLLPIQHEIRKSVTSRYIKWLVKIGGDSNLIATLREELRSALSVIDDPDEKWNFDRIVRENEDNPRLAIPLHSTKVEILEDRVNWADLPSRNETSIGGSFRAYFKTRSTAELDKTIKAENSWRTRLTTNFPLIIIAALFALFVTSVVREPDTKALPPFYQALMGKTFATIDGSISLSVKENGIVINGQNLKNENHSIVWRGSLSDEFRLLRGDYDKCLWLIPSEQGLHDLTGLTFWDEASEQTRIARTMKRVAAGAQSFYQNNHRYPTASEATTLYTYQNPITKKIEPVQAYSFNTFSPDSSVKDRKLDSRMLRGESFEQETAPSPGSVAILSVINKPYGRVELPNQPVECQFAYLHAYDREGQLIRAVNSDLPLVLSLGKGVTEWHEDNALEARFKNAILAVSQEEPPNSALVLLKYITCVLLALSLLAYLIWVKQTAVKNFESN